MSDLVHVLLIVWQLHPASPVSCISLCRHMFFLAGASVYCQWSCQRGNGGLRYQLGCKLWPMFAKSCRALIQDIT